MNSVDVLMRGLVDYAGLFPPAELDLREAAANYQEYLAGPDVSALGRFIIPVSRLDELDAVASGYFAAVPKGHGWRIAALLAEASTQEIERVSRFNAEHRGGGSAAIIDSVELRAAGEAAIRMAAERLPKEVTTYYELPLDNSLERNVAAIHAAGGRAKIRTGGVVAGAFPASRDVLRFIGACLDEGLAFKATAGLHHPVRSEFPLTYAKGSERATMFGFLNVFLSAAFLRAGRGKETALAILEERDRSVFHFSDEWVEWRGERIASADIGETRSSFAVSFGSCSFREPVDELRLLTLAEASA